MKMFTGPDVAFPGPVNERCVSCGVREGPLMSVTRWKPGDRMINSRCNEQEDGGEGEEEGRGILQDCRGFREIRASLWNCHEAPRQHCNYGVILSGFKCKANIS